RHAAASRLFSRSYLTLFFTLVLFFFFKQKTAYDIGLGIPAEPLFRSCFDLYRYCWRQVAIQNRVASNIGISQSTFSVKVLNLFRSEERRVGKECRSRW